MADFGDQVANIAADIKERMRLVASRSIEDIVEMAQTETPGKMLGHTVKPGFMPIFTRDLVESLESSRNGETGPMGRDSFRQVLAEFELGDSLSFEWTEPYAMLVHEGFTDFGGQIRRQDGGWQWVSANTPKFSYRVEYHTEQLS